MNLSSFVILAQEHRCRQCTKRFEKPWVIPSGKPYPDNLTVNGELVFHWESSHGFPKEIFLEGINKLLNHQGSDPIAEWMKEKGINQLKDLKFA